MAASTVGGFDGHGMAKMMRGKVPGCARKDGRMEMMMMCVFELEEEWGPLSLRGVNGFLRLPTGRFTLGSDLPWGSYGRYRGLIAKLEHVIAVRLAFHNKSASIVYSTTSGVRRRSVREI